MSTCLSHREGVIAKKRYRCDLCGEPIDAGMAHDTRSGIGDCFWTMRLHPECHRYEQSPEVRERLNSFDWYEDISEPAFDRSEAHSFEESQLRLP